MFHNYNQFNIGFPGQIREFTIQILLLCIQNRQTWSGYENYHSTLFLFSFDLAFG